MKRFAIRCVIVRALILAAFASSAGANEIGRLFFSPDQRQNLNQKRSNVTVPPARVPTAKVSPDTVTDPVSTASVPIPPQRITGRVTRSSGNNTVWINQTPNYARYSSKYLSKE